MSEQNYIIQGKSIKAIADAVRAKRNVQLSRVGAMTPAEIAAEVHKIRLGCPIAVSMHTNGNGEWERPEEWPDLDLLTRHDNEVFMTIDNSGRIDDAHLSVSVTTVDTSGVTYEIGGIVDGAFVAEETTTVASGTVYTRVFEQGDAAYPVVRIAATANIIDFNFNGLTVDGHKYDERYNAVVERVGKIYTCNGIWGTYWIERDSTIIGYLTNMTSTWANCYSLQALDLSGWDTSGFTAADWTRTFYLTRALKALDLSMFDLSKITQWGSASYPNAMSNFIIDFTAGANNSGKFKPTAYKTLNLTLCVLITRQSLLNVIDMLASGVSGYTLKIGTINLNKLTAEEKAFATAKGWSIIA